MQTVTGQSIVK